MAVFEIMLVNIALLAIFSIIFVILVPKTDGLIFEFSNEKTHAHNVRMSFSTFYIST